MASSRDLSITCQCGAAKQTVHIREESSDRPQGLYLCHCAMCRHNTGLLCTSYAAIKIPGSIEGLVAYRSRPSGAGTSTRFFCTTCGCHVFRRLELPEHDNDTEIENGGIRLPTTEQTERWDVATGVIIGPCMDVGKGESSEEEDRMLMRYTEHINVAGTKDGGLSVFIRSIGNSEVERIDPPPNTDLGSFSPRDRSVEKGEELLNASCHCKTVRFHITRPGAASKLPRSNFPDLMVPYNTGSPLIRNPEDDKWWLRPGLGIPPERNKPGPPQKNELRRYLAGTCACRSCRLISGFEIQTWAFVPRANIFFHIREGQQSLPTPSSQIIKEANEAEDMVVPLDFETLPSNILTSYESKEGVRREFCSRCGATVFWRDHWRPELMDVSVGLLDADEGARAETWLDWWTGRVSFAEDAGTGRVGETAKRAKDLIGSLGEGLRTWGESRK
ncbi:hypothetical protein F4861DRAFT_122218 [Xylaria intraflava]|nr:hypothetical protein F4861DRAFT_122218 [Xylaria intraflava]